jgi:hypothetical protein
MADIADVERALVILAGAALGLPDAYLPGSLGTAQCGFPVRLFRGWPIAKARDSNNQEVGLDADLAAGRTQVSVYTQPNSARLTTRYENQYIIIGAPSPTLTATVSGRSVTFGGTASVGQVVGILVGNGVNPTGYAYRLTATDTPSTIAASFAATIPSATSSGAVLTIPSGGDIRANVVADAAANLETRRQEQVFRVVVWAPTPAIRDQIAGALDDGLSSTTWLPIAGNEPGHMLYRGTVQADGGEKVGLWRRDLTYSVEYGTTTAASYPSVLFAFGSLGIGVGAPSIIVPVGPQPASS